ncbi:MAG: adenylate cyclase regulatory domain-containing protein [Candidatus Binatia bacterium]
MSRRSACGPGSRHRLIVSGALGPHDVERARLIQALLRSGIALETIVRVDGADGFLARYTDAPREGGAVYSLEEAAERIGVDVAMVTLLAEAARLIERRDLLAQDDLDALAALKVALDAGFPEEALRQLVRVYVDALGRVADAENRLFHFYVHDRLTERGIEGTDLLATGEALRGRLVPLIEPMLLYFHRQAWTRAQREDAVLHFHRDPLAPVAGEPPGQLDVAIAFVDLAGFTLLTEAMGDEAAADVLERFSQLVRQATARVEGRVVKQIGDAFMLVFADARAAIACALDIERQTAGEPQFAAVRTGVHCGRVLYREGDYVGTGVNVATPLSRARRRHRGVRRDDSGRRRGRAPVAGRSGLRHGARGGRRRSAAVPWWRGIRLLLGAMPPAVRGDTGTIRVTRGLALNSRPIF